MNFLEMHRNAGRIFTGRVAVHLISAPGRGKSTFIHELVQAFSLRDKEQWGECNLFLGTMSPVDLAGFMVPSKDPSTNEVISRYSRPTWMTTTCGRDARTFKRGILFMDEFGQAEPDVKKVAADLTLNKRIGQWALPSGWVIVMASNRSTDRSGITKDFDFLINRRQDIQVTDHLDSLLAWLGRHGKRPEVTAFCAQNPETVFTEGVPDKQGPWPTPRSVTTAFDVLADAVTPDQPLPTDDLAAEQVQGMVGAGAAAQIAAFLRLQGQIPTMAQIVANPEGVAIPRGPDGMMLVCHQLAARVDGNTIQPCITYVNRLPKEFGVTFVRSTMNRNPELLNTTAFGNWITKNSSLVQAAV